MQILNTTLSLCFIFKAFPNARENFQGNIKLMKNLFHCRADSILLFRGATKFKCFISNLIYCKQTNSSPSSQWSRSIFMLPVLFNGLISHPISNYQILGSSLILLLFLHVSKSFQFHLYKIFLLYLPIKTAMLKCVHPTMLSAASTK